MLTFEQKQAIIESFPELTRKDVSMKRVNYHFEDSLYDKTIVVQHLHPNGNGFVYAAGIPGYKTDERGLVNIREATEEELRTIIRDAIEALSAEKDESAPIEEFWTNIEGVQLVLKEEMGSWNVYHGENLEDSFGDYEEAVDYLTEEQFTLVKGETAPMKGSHLVIGLVLFVLLIVAGIYFTMTATFKKSENGFEWLSAIEYTKS